MRFWEGMLACSSRESTLGSENFTETEIAIYTVWKKIDEK